MLRTLGDFATAFDQGRWHLQRFLKNAGTSHQTQWCDPTFASGQPAYDARVGTAATFTPCVAQKNDAIYFPGIAAGMERRLTNVAMWTNQATYNGPGSVVVYDLLGYYPLIDGDSMDPQVCDNAFTLPRYADGDGVQLVIVNHVAPALVDGIAVINYVDRFDNPQTVTTRIRNQGQNLISSSSDSTSAAVGSVFVGLQSATGIKSITDITYTTPPGGLHCFYLVRPLTTVVLGDNQLFTFKELIAQNGMLAPRIYDGAWLGFFDMIANGGTARAVNWFGHFTFAWG
jgi:hypothetical protein